MVTILVVQGPIYRLAGVRKSGFAESVGIPLQQIAYSVTQNGSMTPEQEQFISNLLPLEEIKASYHPNFSDTIKFHPNFNNEYLEAHKGEFFQVWLGMLPSNFVSYIKAYCTQTLGYWHTGTTNWLIDRSVLENDLGIAQRDIIEQVTGIDGQAIYNSYFQCVTGCPGLKYWYNIAFAVWAVLFMGVTLLLRRQYSKILPLLPLVLLWGTMLIATPTFCEFRYMYSFHLSLPVLVVYLFLRDTTAQDDPTCVEGSPEV